VPAHTRYSAGRSGGCGRQLSGRMPSRAGRLEQHQRQSPGGRLASQNVYARVPPTLDVGMFHHLAIHLAGERRGRISATPVSAMGTAGESPEITKTRRDGQPLHKTLAESKSRGSGTRRNAQFVEDIGHMTRNSVLTEDEYLSNLSVGSTVDDQAHDVHLALSQPA
jgi:hypothetical protein